jgi:class 3 adenylate cyclase
MPDLPSGTVTFVFSDIEGSTSLLKRLGDDAYPALLRTHRRLVRETFAEHHGQEIDTQGDAFFYSFRRARDAVRAAVALQRAHLRHRWPEGISLRIRLGLHTGEPAVGDEGYTGIDVVRASRIAGIARGGQVLLSETTRALVARDLPEGVTLRALGEQQLRGIDRPEPLHELRIADVPVSEEPARPDWRSGPVRRSDVPSVLPPGPREIISSVMPVVDRTSQLIEERVLAEIEESLRTRRGATLAESRQVSTGGGRPRSVADEIAKLRALRDEGALTDEQYARAVDRATAEEP